MKKTKAVLVQAYSARCEDRGVAYTTESLEKGAKRAHRDAGQRVVVFLRSSGRNAESEVKGSVGSGENRKFFL